MRKKSQAPVGATIKSYKEEAVVEKVAADSEEAPKKGKKGKKAEAEVVAEEVVAESPAEEEAVAEEVVVETPAEEASF